MLVDLVEVVLQDLHLVLRGAARGLRRHGPGVAAPGGEAAAVREAAAGGMRRGTGQAGRGRARGCPLRGRTAARVPGCRLRRDLPGNLTAAFPGGVWAAGRKVTPRAPPKALRRSGGSAAVILKNRLQSLIRGEGAAGDALTEGASGHHPSPRRAGPPHRVASFRLEGALARDGCTPHTSSRETTHRTEATSPSWAALLISSRYRGGDRSTETDLPWSS